MAASRARSRVCHSASFRPYSKLATLTISTSSRYHSIAFQRRDGSSLVPLLSGDPARFVSDRPLHWENAREQAVRKGPWKAYRPTPDDPMELFLVEEDVSCERDLADAYPDVVAEMERIMHREHVDHPWYGNAAETSADSRRKESLARDLGHLQVARQGISSP